MLAAINMTNTVCFDGPKQHPCLPFANSNPLPLETSLWVAVVKHSTNPDLRFYKAIFGSDWNWKGNNSKFPTYQIECRYWRIGMMVLCNVYGESSSHKWCFLCQITGSLCWGKGPKWLPYMYKPIYKGQKSLITFSLFLGQVQCELGQP